MAADPAPLPFIGATPAPGEALVLVMASAGYRRGEPCAGAAAVLARGDGSSRVVHRVRGGRHDESFDTELDDLQELAYLVAGLAGALGRAGPLALEHDADRGLALLRVVEAPFGRRAH